MGEWIDVAPETSLAEGEHLLVDMDGVEVAVFRIQGELCAFEDACTHDGGEIASGRIEGNEIICPRHGARFCLKSGLVLKPPAYENLKCFALRVENGMIQLHRTD